MGISRHDARELILDELEKFAETMGLNYYRYSQQTGGLVKPELLPIKADDAEEELKLLLDHLGLKIESGKRIVKVKKEKE